MIFGLGTVSLSDITWGILSTGVVPLGRMLRTSMWGDNAGDVTVLAAYTNIVVLGSVDVAVGDILLMNASLFMTKGAATGSSNAYIDKDSGTATVRFLSTARVAGCTWGSVYIGEAHGGSISAIGRVTVGGTFVLRLYASSAVSSSHVAAEDGQLGIWVLRGN